MRNSCVVVLFVGLASCSNAKDPAQPSSSASVPTVATPSASELPAELPSVKASSSAIAENSAAPAVTSAAPPVDAPLPSVDVTNIGMHVGGGKNDDAEKAPIKRSVEPHMDAFRRCWTSVDDPAKGGIFRLDLTIPAAGGKATQAHPKTSLKPEAFKTCMLAVFDGIDFEKPKGGKTTVSYSLRFAPKTK